MIIGVPKEIKSNENRVALTPGGAFALIQQGHEVYLQSGAGLGSSLPDQSYMAVGVHILDTIEEVYAIAEMIVKVKEPLESEYKLIKKDQIVFTYFHFASNEGLTHAMIASGAICIAYETVTTSDGKLPLLIPMSEVAGRMAVQEGAKYLEKIYGGKGVLLGGVPGVEPARVLILGGGIVGTHAALMAAGLGASVTILDTNLSRLRQLSEIMPANVNVVFSSATKIEQHIVLSDLIIGAVLIPGAKAPKLITRKMLKSMQKGTVLIDVAVDQGGCIETCTPTTHENPTYMIDDVLHYCVANMPGAVPMTSTYALTNATLSYAIAIANKGWKEACKNDNSLRAGLNIVNGKNVLPALDEVFHVGCTDLQEVL